MNLRINIIRLRQDLTKYYILLLIYQDVALLLAISDQGHSVHSNSSLHIRLPTIALPTFAGDTCSCLHFRDTFEALVVNNATVERSKVSLPYCFTQERSQGFNIQFTNY